MNTVEKHPGAEPLPGYRLLKLLGRGGFGEVWKCEAPGRLHKAIKFVAGGDQLRTELSAFEHVRTIRHPYLMSLERVELLAGELVMVMELADGQVNDRFHACVTDGLRGIPRDELLSYLKEAAEALDFLSSRYRLQHLDVKPENLLLLAGHVKVGDYGLVRRADPTQPAAVCEFGFTPRYAAPEVLQGGVDHRSDQYSLALVYTELLTGAFPFTGKSAQQLLMQHLTAVPDLTALPAHERDIVEQALSKKPTERFSSSSAFIRALSEAKSDTRAANVASQPDPSAQASSAMATTASDAMTAGPVQRVAGETTAPGLNRTVNLPPTAAPSPDRPGMRRPSAQRKEPPPPKPAVLQEVMSTDQLNGMPLHKAPAARISKDTLVHAVVDVAARSYCGAAIDAPSAALVRHFLCTVPPSIIPLKLAVVANPRNLKIDQGNPGRVVLRHEAPPKLPPTSKREARRLAELPKSGYEIAVYFPAAPSALLTLVGSLFGPPDQELLQRAEAEIAAIMDEIKNQLHNKVERRTHPRFPAGFPVLAYPYYTDGEVGAPVAGQCRDISEGGIRFTSPLPIRTSNIYIEFKDLDHLAGSAVLVQVIRSGQEPGGREFVTVGRFGAGA
jgi:eukaryotic-like serine/threonine-protein kinase